MPIVFNSNKHKLSIFRTFIDIQVIYKKYTSNIQTIVKTMGDGQPNSYIIETL